MNQLMQALFLLLACMPGILTQINGVAIDIDDIIASKLDTVKDEYELKQTIFKRYLKSVRPVKKYSSAVKVQFDMALRAIVDLDERNQILTTNTWIRVYWSDENLVWDPAKYHGMTQINLPPHEIWVPDLVLYNSADIMGRGLLDFSMKTHIQVNHDGSCIWLCPMVLKSDCTVDIEFFPFDSQKCPLQFGLWTYDVTKANFTIHPRKAADLVNYLPNGEWVLESMPGRRHLQYFPCCPNQPFPYIIYKINMIRRTKFFLMNLIWPGILIALLAALSYILPPECGERVGLGITNILAMMVFLLLISEAIPPTSDAIPLASKFFTSVLVLSAFTLVSSALVISFTINTDPDVTKIPWFVTVVINRWLARMLLVYTPSLCCRSRKDSKMRNYTLQNITPESSAPNRANGGIGNGLNTNQQCESKDSEDTYALTGGDSEVIENLQKTVEGIAQRVSGGEAFDEYKREWRKAAKVMDRFFLLCFIICLLGSLLSVYINAPRFTVN